MRPTHGQRGISELRHSPITLHVAPGTPSDLRLQNDPGLCWLSQAMTKTMGSNRGVPVPKHKIFRRDRLAGVASTSQVCPNVVEVRRLHNRTARRFRRFHKICTKKFNNRSHVGLSHDHDNLAWISLTQFITTQFNHFRVHFFHTFI